MTFPYESLSKMGALEIVLLGLLCLSAFGDGMPQTPKYVRKLHIIGKPGQPRDVIKTRTIIPAVPEAPVLDEQKDIVEFTTVNNVNTPARKRTADEEAELFRKQAESAKYAFESSVDDGINGISQSRAEVRDGLKLKGMYSYSDGFYNRTVFYEADENGYRIVKEENQPIGDGPLINPDGEAIVRSSLGSDYKITINDIQKKTRHIDQRFSESN